MTSNPWILLAEDDKLFAALFQRFWVGSFPEVQVVLVPSVAEARKELQNRPTPVAAVLDYTLSDGTSEELSRELSCPFVLWSACGEGHLQAKPTGRDELGRAVQQVAALAGLLPLE
ncbi:MAG: hypothetical protein WC314_16225 [Vulcanimicrobiota bacterium]